MLNDINVFKTHYIGCYKLVLFTAIHYNLTSSLSKHKTHCRTPPKLECVI